MKKIAPNSFAVLVATSCLLWSATSANSQLSDNTGRPQDAGFIEHLAVKDPNRALDLLHARLIREPDNLYLLLVTGRLEMEMELTKLSAKRYERYLALNPKSQNVEARVRLANDYTLMQMPAKAESVYNDALKNIPNNASLYCERGCFYDSLKQQHRAISDLDKAIELDPKNIHYLQERGTIYAHYQRYAAAVADFTSVINSGKSPTLIYSKRAAVYEKMGKHQLAQKDMAQINKFSQDMLGDLKN